MKKKSAVLLLSLFLSFFLVMQNADAATLLIGGSSSVSLDITYYTAPGQPAPASVSADLKNITTSGFTSGFVMSFVGDGWNLDGKKTFSSSSDLTAGRDFVISGAPGTAPVTMTLRAIDLQNTSADATVQVNFKALTSEFSLSTGSVDVALGSQAERTVNLITTPANTVFSDLQLSDGTAPTNPLRWNGLTITANRLAKSITITGTPERPGSRTFQVIASGTWGTMTRDLNIRTEGVGSADLVGTTVYIANLKADCAAWLNPKTCTAYRMREYTDYKHYTNFNLGAEYYVAFIAAIPLPDLRVELQEPGCPQFKMLSKIPGKLPVSILGKKSALTQDLMMRVDDREAAASTLGYYVAESGGNQMIFLRVGPNMSGNYTFRITYSAGDRDHKQDIVLRCTPELNSGDNGGSGCDAGLGLFAVGALVLGSLLFIRKER